MPPRLPLRVLRCPPEAAALLGAARRGGGHRPHAVNIFHREQRSLFGEILDWMLTPLLLLWPVSLVLTWLVAQNIAGKPFDRALEYNAHAIAQLITVNHGQAGFSLPRPARELLRADDSDTVYYQVLGPRGEFL